jgi:hypothetical protein
MIINQNESAFVDLEGNGKRWWYAKFDPAHNSGMINITCPICGNDNVIAQYNNIHHPNNMFPGYVMIPMTCENRHNIALVMSGPSSSMWLMAEQKLDYPLYLQSIWWKTISLEAKERAGHRCQLCNKKGVLHTHHRTYENIGNENPEDLIVLCAKCHAKFHNKDQ